MKKICIAVDGSPREDGCRVGAIAYCEGMILFTQSDYIVQQNPTSYDAEVVAIYYGWRWLIAWIEQKEPAWLTDSRLRFELFTDCKTIVTQLNHDEIEPQHELLKFLYCIKAKQSRIQFLWRRREHTLQEAAHYLANELYSLAQQNLEWSFG